MPLNVRRFCNSFLLIFTFCFYISAQTLTPNALTATAPQPSTAAPLPPAPSAADVMRERVAKAKAFIAVKNYNAAIYELENIRRETSDQTVHGVINVLLMNSFLEQGDYKRAQDHLTELAKAQKANKPYASANYFAAAGQVVKGARTQLERYKSLGLSVADRSLPKEAVGDLQKMRETLESVVTQSKVIVTDKKQVADAMALIEEATNARGSLAKDEYDAKRWKDEIADAREMLANSRSVILNAAGEPTTVPTANTNVGANKSSVGQISSAAVDNPATTAAAPQNTATFLPVPNSSDDALKQAPVTNNVSQPSNQTTAQTGNIPNDAPTTTTPADDGQNRNRRVENAGGETATANQINNPPTVSANPNNSVAATKSTSPMQVGSLIEYATEKANPVYPSSAKIMRASGVVRVELTVDEKGQVSEVQKTSGPSLLQRAATEAVKKWRFKPFVRDGEPVRATGFVNFNFSL